MKRREFYLLLPLLIIGGFMLNIEGCKEKAWYPAFNEKDTNLIEAFIREMNLLDALEFSDRQIFDTQLARVHAAQQNIEDLGSSNRSMLPIRFLAITIPTEYSIAMLEPSSNSIKKARNGRDHFIKTYHILQHGATYLEVSNLDQEYEDKIEK
jgi:hypothetical protein